MLRNAAGSLQRHAFLVPPTGYAVMMARSAMATRRGCRPLASALAPYLGVQLVVVLALVVALLHWLHLAEPARPA